MGSNTQKLMLAARRRLLSIWVLMLVFGIAGCGSSDPDDQGPAVGPGLMVSVSIPDINNYLADVRRTYATISLMTSEFGTISEGWSVGFYPNYWTRQFLNNLRLRLEILKVQVEGIRPADFQLLSIHADYEKALVNFDQAFRAFDSQIDISSGEGLEQVNLLLLAGNLDLDRFQLRLRNLSGLDIQL
jgi:hypothetical protein